MFKPGKYTAAGIIDRIFFVCYGVKRRKQVDDILHTHLYIGTRPRPVHQNITIRGYADIIADIEWKQQSTVWTMDRTHKHLAMRDGAEPYVEPRVEILIRSPRGGRMRTSVHYAHVFNEREYSVLTVCRYTGVPFEATRAQQTTHPQVRAILHLAHRADLIGVMMKRLRVARDFGVTDIIEVFVTFARTGDAAYLAGKIQASVRQ